jgi:hypothetical protein
MLKTRETSWWMLYALVPVMGGLLVFEFRAPLVTGLAQRRASRHHPVRVRPGVGVATGQRYRHAP